MNFTPWKKKKHIIYKIVSNKASERANSKEKKWDIEKKDQGSPRVHKRKTESTQSKTPGHPPDAAFYKEPHPRAGSAASSRLGVLLKTARRATETLLKTTFIKMGKFKKLNYSLNGEIRFYKKAELTSMSKSEDRLWAWHGGRASQQWNPDPKGVNGAPGLRSRDAEPLKVGLTMDRTLVPSTGMWILDHWTTREVLEVSFNTPVSCPSLVLSCDMFGQSSWIFWVFWIWTTWFSTLAEVGPEVLETIQSHFKGFWWVKFKKKKLLWLLVKMVRKTFFRAIAN